MTNKKLRQRERKGNVTIENDQTDSTKIKKDISDNLVKSEKLKVLGDLSRTKEKKTHDKIRKNNRNGKFISLGL